MRDLSNPYFTDRLSSELWVSPVVYAPKPAPILFMAGDDYSADVNTTGVLTLDGAASSGTHETFDDEDWFAITVTAGDLIRIEGVGTPPNLVLIAPDGTEVDFSFLALGGSNPDLSQAYFRALETGTYFISAKTQFSSPDSYTLTATSLAAGTLAYNSTAQIFSGGFQSGFSVNFPEELELVQLDNGTVLAIVGGQQNSQSMHAVQIIDPLGNSLQDPLYIQNAFAPFFAASDDGFAQLSMDFILSRYNFDGQLLGSTDIFAQQAFTGNIFGLGQLKAASDGGYFLDVGRGNADGTGPYDVVVLKINAAGDNYTIFDEQNYTSNNGQTLASSAEMSNGDVRLIYFDFGQGETDMTQVLLSASGTVISTQTQTTQIGGAQITELTDGGYAVVGSVNDGGFSDVVAFEIFNADGTVRQAQVTTEYNGTGNFGFFAGGASALADGGFAFIVATETGNSVLRYSAQGILMGEPLPLTTSGQFINLELDAQGGLVALYQVNGEIFIQSLETDAAASQTGDATDNLLYASALGGTLTGLGGDDYLAGNLGDDIIDGGAGDDKLFGGQGADVFIFNAGSGQDVIGDFNTAEDQLVLELDPYLSLTALREMFTDFGGYTVMNMGGDSITFEGLQAEDFDLDNFSLTGFLQDGIGPFRHGTVTLSEKGSGGSSQQSLDDAATVAASIPEDVDGF